MANLSDISRVLAYLGDSLVALTALILFVLLLRKPVAQYLGAHATYWLWLLPLARAVMPPLADTAPASPMAQQSGMVFAAMAPPIAGGNQMAQAAPDWLEIVLAPLSAIDGPIWLVGLWLVGAAVLFAWHVAHYVRLIWHVQRNGKIQGQVSGIDLVMTPYVSGPVALGIVRRRILLPENFDSNYSAQERDLVLAHEVSHHRSGDLIINLFAFALLCLMWFNPVAWIGWRAFRLDQEAACDSRVLAGQDDITKLTYGRALVRGAATGLPVFATAMHAPHSIVHRLRRLTMTHTSVRRSVAGKIAICTAAIAMLPLTASYIPAAAEDAKSPEAQPKIIRKIVINKDKTAETISPDSKYSKTITGTDGKKITVYSDIDLNDTDIQKLAQDAKGSTAGYILPGAKSVEVAVRVIGSSKSQGATYKNAMSKDDISKALVEAFGGPDKSLTCDQGKESNAKNAPTDSANPNVIVRFCGTSNTLVSNAAKVAAIRAAIAEIRIETSISQDARGQAIRQMEATIKMLEATPAE